MGGGNLVSKRDKLLNKIKNNKKDVNINDFKTLLNQHGFIISNRRGKGSHFMYYHPEYTDIRRTVNISKPLRKHHIETLISDIEKVKK